MIFFVSRDALYVIIPALLSTNILLFSIIFLWNRTGSIPFFDIGFFCLLTTFIYTVYPLVNYLLDGLQFGILADGRLRAHEIKPEELGFFHYRHVIYLFSLSFAYLSARKNNPVNEGKIQIPNSFTSLSIVFYFVLFTAYFFIVKIAFGLNYNTSYESEAYSRNIQAFASAPLILIQISTKLSGILFLFKIALLFIIISKAKSRQWRLVLFFWVTYEIIDAFFLKGSRTGLMTFLIGVALLYHRIIKALSIRFLLISGSAIFLFFIFLGLYRSYADFVSLQSGLAEADSGFLSSGNEFQALLGTSYDVLKMRENGTSFPIYLYINDFINILPPQQLLPFDKVEASEWYLRELGINGTGVGFMWGVVSQALVGFDWLELIFRGILLGLLLAWMHNFYLRKQNSFLFTLSYVYMCLRIYYTFRDTTFSPLAFVVWELLPFYIFLRIGEISFRLIKSNSNSNFNRVIS